MSDPTGPASGPRRAGGARRAEIPRGGGRARRVDGSVLLALLVPALALGLAVAAPVEQPDLAPLPPRTTPLTAVTLVCPSALDPRGTVTVAGTGEAGGTVRAGGDEVSLRPGRVASTTGRDAVVLRAEGPLAPGLVAGRSRTSPLAALDCPPPSAEQWFTGVGAGPEHSSVLELVNPGAGPAVADVTVLGANGPVDAPSLRGILVPGGETRRLELATLVPRRGELALRVTTGRGRLTAAVEDTLDRVGRGEAATDWLPVQVAPATVNLLLGLAGSARQQTLVLANPGVDEVRAEVRLVTAASTFAPAGVDEVRVPPGSVTRVSLSAVLGSPGAQGALGLEVRSTGPLTGALRSTADGDLVHAVGGATVEEATAAVLPGGRKRLVLGGGDGTVSLVVRSATGRELVRRDVTAAPGRGVGLRLPSTARHLELVTDGAPVTGAVLVEGAGAAVLPLRDLVGSGLVPGVRPALRGGP